MGLATIVVLVCLIVALVIYNISLYKKIQTYKNTDARVSSLNMVLQNFMNIVGSDASVDKKLKGINEIIIEKYHVKYSTVVIFDGTDYVIKASNVNTRHWGALSKLHEVAIFSDSIEKAKPKYVTVNGENEKLPYQENEFGRAKSAIFFPLYIDNVYLGYWIIESGIPHDFDNIDTTIFEAVKENIITVLKAVNYQKTLENITRTDLFTGLKSAEYLYGEGKKTIDLYTTSAVCMFKISNIETINKIARELGNKVIIEVSKRIKESISNNYIFVRYMGPKFVIVFSGVEADNVRDFINEIKETSEKLQISLNDDIQIKEQKPKKGRRRKKREDIVVSPSLNFVVSTYYKGTGIEEVLKRMEKYIDDASEEQQEINNI